ncbi:MAG: helicase C-terminal domain-containing protein [bacterium]
MSKVKKYFSSEAAKTTREQIQEAGGNEVFFVGYLDENRKVISVEVFTRGNESSAPALMQVARPGNVVIHNHPSGGLRPSSADMQVASNLGNDGIGFYIVDNAVSDVYAVVEPFSEKKPVPIETDTVTHLIDEKGPIAKKLERYEFRPQQIKMIELLTEAINENKVALVEAGTGTGKTLAYLLPAITYAINNEERIVVSTNTINLQEQLIHKDLPFLKTIFKSKFKAVLVKGRSNYACRRKLQEADQELDLFADDASRSELQAIIQWSKATQDGSKADLPIQPRPDTWEKIQSESDTSLKTKCPFYDTCFFYSARRKAATADILVANHHLLFADLALRAVFGASENAILPAYQRIIFDEAQNIEEVATSYFGIGVTYLGVKRILNKLFNRNNGQEKGVLPFLLHKLLKFSRGMPTDPIVKVMDFLREEGTSDIESLNFYLAETMEQIFYTVQRLARSEYGESKLRLNRQILKTSDWQNNILNLTRKLVQEMRKFASRLSQVSNALDAIQQALHQSVVSLSIDLQAQAERLDAAAETIGQILLNFDQENIRWIEVKEGYKGLKIVRLRLSPLEVAPILHEAVYKKFKNIVLTSATLTVAQNFDYLKNRLGLNFLDSGKILQRSLPAPFDFPRQVILAVPSDIPEPQDPRFTRILPDLLLKLVKISRGRAFILFTSYGLLNKMFNRLQAEIEQLGFNVYKQGQENRHRLLERFKSDVSSVLFATDSFWEGVDVPGAALESVIITRLPFKVPSEPVVEARVEAIEKSGGNAFLEYTVPQAVIKFRQGFGRLIRSRSDRGSVIILDKRVIQKSYGRIFLESLPKCQMVAAPVTDMLQKLQKFMNENA